MNKFNRRLSVGICSFPSFFIPLIHWKGIAASFAGELTYGMFLYSKKRQEKAGSAIDRGLYEGDVWIERK
jgi:hypothetical protein